VLGETREQIAAEKLAVVQEGTVVVLPDREFAHLAGANVVVGGAREAAAAFLGRPVEREVEVALPGRLERRGPDELWDGAHNPEGVRWLAAQLPPGRRVVVASILADKDADAMLAALASLGDRFVATRSSNARALPAEELAARARPYFAHVETVPEPGPALARARELGPVLVTGSLYLLADLSRNGG
jgi:folylpolyglutamate synthase/dihydropteroate synthase